MQNKVAKVRESDGKERDIKATLIYQNELEGKARLEWREEEMWKGLW